VILEIAKKREPNLLVVGTSGHGAWQRFFLGSTASHIVQEAPCPVLVVPTVHETRAEKRKNGSDAHASS
jgi:nucleotide-binding universal stress UspA family protein